MVAADGASRVAERLIVCRGRLASVGPARMTTIQMPPPIQWNMSCYGFYLWGADSFHAGQDFRGRQGSVVRHFLYSQAIELGLKEYLLFKGESKKALRTDYGHSLSTLLRESRNLGLDQYVTFTGDETTTIGIATNFCDSGAAGRRLRASRAAVRARLVQKRAHVGSDPASERPSRTDKENGCPATLGMPRRTSLKASSVSRRTSCVLRTSKGGSHGSTPHGPSSLAGPAPS